MKRFIALALTLFLSASAHAQDGHFFKQGDVFFLGGFDAYSTDSDAMTRLDPTLDVGIGRGAAAGVRLIRETGYVGTYSTTHLWSVGPRAAYFPFGEALSWFAGGTAPYVHGGVMHTWITEERDRITGEGVFDSRAIQTRDRGWGFYGGAGLSHDVFRGLGLFVEMNLIGGFNFQTPEQPGDFRFGLSLMLQ